MGVLLSHRSATGSQHLMKGRMTSSPLIVKRYEHINNYPSMRKHNIIRNLHYHHAQKKVRKLTIKEARKAAGLTQLEMAKVMGIPARTIQNWEGGQRKCPEWCEKLVVAELERIAKKN